MQVHARARRFRKCVTITLPPDLVETARQKRINISRIAEIALKQTLGVEESHELATNGGKGFFPPALSFQERAEVPRAGFEPASVARLA